MESRTTVPVVSGSRGKGDVAEVVIACVSGLLLAYTVLFLCILPLVGKIASGREFTIYWATGQQLVHHANPYDTEAMSRIEQAAGLPSTLKVGLMRNPPWGLILALPLGLVGVRTGAVLWSLVLLVCLGGSVQMLWAMHGRQKNNLHWVGLAFLPALLCLTMGQTSIFALLGLVLFLRLHRTSAFLAGVSLWLCALKPHLFLAFGVVLVAWVLVTRSYKVFAGAAVALAASCAAVYAVDPMAWAQYSQMMRTYGIEKEPIPCVSILLRLWISPQATWLQYLLPGLGCVWALGYYWTRRHAWNWLKEGSLLMLVSMVTAPYCWLFDQALAIPALLEGAYRTGSKILLIVLVLASVLLEAELIGGIRIFSVFYLWTAPAWLAWYLLACLTARDKQTIEWAGE